VGVDGSAGSIRALRFALTEATLRGARLDAVCAWRPPADYGGPVVVPVDYDPEKDARGAVAESFQAVTDIPKDDVEVIVVTPEGPPARALLDEAVGADLLVVGTRGHGGFAGLLLGSVSKECVHHATCPVVVVP
jgi:nucleotide-binding universal stress UspA family protein